MFSLHFFQAQKVPSTLVIVIWIIETMQFYKLKVGEWICSKILLIAVLHFYCNFVFKTASLQGDLAATTAGEA